MVAKLGDFLVDIDTEVNDRGIKSLAKSLGGLTTKAVKFGGVLTGAVAGAGAGFIKLVKGTVEETAELGRLAEDLSTTTTFLQTFIRSFETVGATGEEAISTVRTLTKEIEAFKLGKGNIEAFGILGINPQNLGADVGKNFDVIRQRFNDLTAAQRLFFVDQIGLGEKALRVLRLSDEAYQDLTETSREFPLATREQVDSARQFDRGLTRLGQSFKAFKLNLVSEVTPAFTDFVNEMVGLFGSKTFQEDVGKFFDSIFKDGLPKIVKATPIIVNSIGEIANSISNLVTSMNELGENPFIKALGGGIKGIGTAFDVVAGGIGRGVAKVISSQADRKVLPLRDPSDIEGGFRLQPLQSEIDALLIKSTAKVAERNLQISAGGNNITVNVPIQRLGTDITEEDRLARRIADELDKTMKDTTENLKTGVVQ
jgi:hypothetical protein